MCQIKRAFNTGHTCRVSEQESFQQGSHLPCVRSGELPTRVTPVAGHSRRAHDTDHTCRRSQQESFQHGSHLSQVRAGELPTRVTPAAGQSRADHGIRSHLPRTCLALDLPWTGDPLEVTIEGESAGLQLRATPARQEPRERRRRKSPRFLLIPGRQ